MYALVQIKDKITKLENKILHLQERNDYLVDRVKDMTYQLKLLREMIKRRAK